MATAEGVKNKLRGAISHARRLTGDYNLEDLTTAAKLLAKGYGGMPIPYEEAEDGDKLYTAYFASENFVPIDDTEKPFIEGGKNYLSDGNPATNLPRNQWRKSLVEYPTYVPEGDELVIEGIETTSTDHRFVGHFPDYDLENKTYTLEFESFRNFNKRHKFYFANGNFVDENGYFVDGNGLYPPEWNVPTSGGRDVSTPCLGFELNKYNSQIGYKLYRQSTGFANDAVIFNHGVFDYKIESTGEFVAHMKVVLKGGAKKYVKLYDNNGAAYWIGYVIPIEFTIYHNIDGNDMRVAAGHIYQPADNIGLVFGIGNYDTLANGEYYGVRNLNIYKGDTTEISYIREVSTANEMDAIIKKATAADIGNAYLYVGPTENVYGNLDNVAYIQNTVYIIVAGESDGTFEFDKYVSEGASTSLDAYAGGTSKIVLGSAETIIGRAFSQTSITSVDMPAVWGIGNYAFDYCQQLDSVSFPKIQSIGEFAFSSCAKLRLTEFPDTLKSIGKAAFSGCYKITPKKLPSGFTTLSASAFSNCSSITEMEIPASITYIGENAFYNCSGLTTVTFKGTIASLGTIFSGCKNLITINVPWSEGEVAGEDTRWGAPNATVIYDYTG